MRARLPRGHRLGAQRARHITNPTGSWGASLDIVIHRLRARPNHHGIPGATPARAAPMVNRTATSHLGPSLRRSKLSIHSGGNTLATTSPREASPTTSSARTRTSSSSSSSRSKPRAKQPLPPSRLLTVLPRPRSTDQGARGPRRRPRLQRSAPSRRRRTRSPNEERPLLPPQRREDQARSSPPIAKQRLREILRLRQPDLASPYRRPSPTPENTSGPPRRHPPPGHRPHRGLPSSPSTNPSPVTASASLPPFPASEACLPQRQFERRYPLLHRHETVYLRHFLPRLPCPAPLRFRPQTPGRLRPCRLEVQHPRSRPRFQHPTRRRPRLSPLPALLRYPSPTRPRPRLSRRRSLPRHPLPWAASPPHLHRPLPRPWAASLHRRPLRRHPPAPASAASHPLLRPRRLPTATRATPRASRPSPPATRPARPCSRASKRRAASARSAKWTAPRSGTAARRWRAAATRGRTAAGCHRRVWPAGPRPGLGLRWRMRWPRRCRRGRRRLAGVVSLDFPLLTRRSWS